jgi:ketol-acid reductoisomerase
MAQIYYESDADLAILHEQTIAVIGFGNQGRAHALNLRDSGLKVIVGARAGGPATHQAKCDGFSTYEIAEAARLADILAIMLPDEHVPYVFEKDIQKEIRDGKAKTFVFAHGFVVANKTIQLPADADVLLVAPTGPGRQVRSLYLEGAGLPALIAVEQDVSKQGLQKALAYAHGIGCTRAGVIKTTFQEETITDLFCEQGCTVWRHARADQGQLQYSGRKWLPAGARLHFLLEGSETDCRSAFYPRPRRHAQRHFEHGKIWFGRGRAGDHQRGSQT